MTDAPRKSFPEIERLLLEMARTLNWVAMYRGDHPSLAGRFEALHAILLPLVEREPSGRLLLGIARDRVFYHDAFIGAGQALVHRLTESLFLNQVATIDFSRAVSPRELGAFFRVVHRRALEKEGPPLPELLAAESLRGIAVHPYNYKDVLSRRIVGPQEAGGESAGEREEELWRMLLTENVGGGGLGDPVEELAVAPELLPAILRRAWDASGPGPAPAPAVAPDLVKRLLGRLGDIVARLPEERREELLRMLETGLDGMAGAVDDRAAVLSVGHSLVEGRSDDEFLGLLASVLSVEEKGGKRLRRVFKLIANERDPDGDALLPKARERVRESLRTKNYFAQKTWELVEGFLLARSETAYIGEDHGHLLEALSSLEEGRPEEGGGAWSRDFSEEFLHRKSVAILLDLVSPDCPGEEFPGILEDLRKIVPILVSRKEFDLLNEVLTELPAIAAELEAERAASVRSLVEAVDAAHVIDLYLSPETLPEDRTRIRAVLSALPSRAVPELLDRLLVEQDKGRRRLLLMLGPDFGRDAVPTIAERMGSPHWYFVRNLCMFLGEIGGPEVVPLLVGALEHPDYRVQREAIVALGKARSIEAVPFLGRILLAETILSNARDDALRIDSANALYLCGGTRGASYLHRALDCRRPAVREHCGKLLEAMRPR